MILTVGRLRFVQLHETYLVSVTNLAFSWLQTSGVTVELANANSINATFLAPAVSTVSTLVFTLTVSNDAGESSDQVVININPGPTVDSVSFYSSCFFFSRKQLTLLFEFLADNYRRSILEERERLWHSYSYRINECRLLAAFRIREYIVQDPTGFLTNEPTRLLTLTSIRLR